MTGNGNELIRAEPGIAAQTVPAGCHHSYFLYLFRLDLSRLGGTVHEFATALAAEGVPNEAHQITGGRPAYLFDLFQKRSALPGGTHPFGAREYRAGDCPVAEDAFNRWITMNIFAHYTERDLEEIAFGIGKVARHFAAPGGIEKSVIG